MSLLDTPICNFGWPAPGFSLATPSGEPHSPQSAVGPNGLLIAFICNHCPYVIAVADRLVADATALQAEGFGVLAVMSNDYRSYPDDSPANMERFATQYGFTFPYLVDEDQSVARAYDAVCTPDFFGFNSKLELQYRGRLDDCRPGASAEQIANRSPDLLNAMRQVGETGNGPQDQIASAGCSIKWK